VGAFPEDVPGRDRSIAIRQVEDDWRNAQPSKFRGWNCWSNGLLRRGLLPSCRGSSGGAAQLTLPFLFLSPLSQLHEDAPDRPPGPAGCH